MAEEKKSRRVTVLNGVDSGPLPGSQQRLEARHTVINPVPSPSRQTQLNERPSRQAQVNHPSDSSAESPVRRRTSLNEQNVQIHPSSSFDQLGGFGYFLNRGTEVCENCSIVQPLDPNAVTGEADLYICHVQEQERVLKLYRRPFDEKALQEKEQITSVINAISEHYVARILRTGLFHGRFFEVMPYYSQYGSLERQLKKNTFSFAQLRDWVIPKLNEGLHAIHEQGLFHRDIKPENIMITNDGKDLVFIDFGVAHEGGHTIVASQVAGTRDYMAPEVDFRVICQETDYYSLGVTIYKLFMGQTPFERLDDDAKRQMAVLRRVAQPDVMPDALYDLIAGLTYVDISNRNDPDNPNRRWTYEHVKRWLAGEKLPRPGGVFKEPDAAGLMKIKVMFEQEWYSDFNELVWAMGNAWDKAKAFLLRNELYRQLSKVPFSEKIDPRLSLLSTRLKNYVDEQKKLRVSDDLILHRFLYEFGENIPAFFWMDGVYEQLSALGQEMLTSLRNLPEMSKTAAHRYGNILTHQLLSNYLASKGQRTAEEDEYLGIARKAEADYAQADTPRGKLIILLTLGYQLARETTYDDGQRQFRNIGELKQSLYEASIDGADALLAACSPLLDSSARMKPLLQAWFASQGYSAAL